MTGRSAPARTTSEGRIEDGQRYWIVVASRDHARHGVENSVIQANHGKREPLERMRPGDGIVVYSPRELFGTRSPLRAFTALGRVAAGPVWQVEMEGGFAPYRRRVDYEPVRDAPLAQLLDRLSFIRNKKSSGAVFRFGTIRIPREDFERIAAAMLGARGGRKGSAREDPPR